ncbi:MAG: hypothetical protein Q9O74_09005 [Planctomycetota bacterium]|nr:hypothetical protein [Planctomycetota bacterium]
MAQKTWQMKVHVDRPELAELLDRRLAQWNEAVAGTVAVLMDMRAGRLGPSGRAMWAYCAKNVQSDPLTWLTKPLPDPPKDTDKFSLSQQYRVEHAETKNHDNDGGHSQLSAVRDSIPNGMWGQMHRRSIEYIKSYEELHKLWQSEHAEWIKAKQKWEDEHPDYMKVRPLVEAFERERGAARGSRVRWTAWCDFLLGSPEIVSWQTPGTRAVHPTQEQIDEIIQKKPRKKVAGALNGLVFKLNPELAAFDREHNSYEREYVRRRAKRRHPDGFRHRPSFTLPSIEKHPDWPRFKGGEGWQNLCLDAGTVELALYEEGKGKWTRVSFVADRRIRALRRLAEPIKITEGKRKTLNYEWQTPAGDTVPAQPQGLKLVKRDGSGGGWHLLVSFEIAPPPCAIGIAQKSAGKYAVSWQQKELAKQDWTPDEPLLTCAVDLGIRDLGAASIARSVLDPETKDWTSEIIARRVLHNRFFLGEGRERAINIPSLSEVARVKKQLRRMRRATGKMAPGKESCARMAAHYRNMQEDRFKKGVAAIFCYARHYGAAAVIFEDLKMLNPDSANDRGINAALSSWNRGAIVGFAEQAAETYGLRVFKVPSYFTSRICAACDAMGIRFDRGAPKWRAKRAKVLEGKSGDALRNTPHLHHLGHWFVCPACERQVHADINASENLHRVLLGLFPKTATVKSKNRNGRAYVWRVNGHEVDKDTIETGAQRVLGLDPAGEPMPETPF